MRRFSVDYARPLTDLNLVLRVISPAYEHLSLTVTVALALEKWTEIFGSGRLTDAPSWKQLGKATDSDGLERESTQNQQLGKL